MSRYTVNDVVQLKFEHQARHTDMSRHRLSRDLGFAIGRPPETQPHPPAWPRLGNDQDTAKLKLVGLMRAPSTSTTRTWTASRDLILHRVTGHIAQQT
jgi:hypothetical protein